MVGLIFLIFFVISFLTNILGPIIPDIIHSFNLSLAMVAFLPFAFFVAYGVMSIPSGIMVEKYKEKKVMVAAFVVATLGALLFSLFPYYSVALISLFLIGCGMAMLQVAINPLLRVAGGEEHFAFNSVMAQLVFGAASFLSPYVYTYLVTNLKSTAQPKTGVIALLSGIVPQSLPWVSLYWLFSIIALIMVIVVAISKFPEVIRNEDEKAGAWATHVSLFKEKTVILYFLGIFCYEGLEQGVANWISQFLYTYHGYSPELVGANIVSWFWGLLTAGCLLGLVLLKIFDSRKILIAFVIASMVCLAVALFSPGWVALIAFPMVGFCASVMWSIIFSLALNSVDKHHGSFSGILCTAIIGGAIWPVLIGGVGDLFGLRQGMLLIFIALSYLLSIGIWAKPIINNETISSKNKKENI